MSLGSTPAGPPKHTRCRVPCSPHLLKPHRQRLRSSHFSLENNLPARPGDIYQPRMARCGP